jgi:hypothetical protein
VEGLENVHSVEDPLDSPHVNTAVSEHVGVLDSELGKSSLVSNDSLGPVVVDPSLADYNPVPFEVKPMTIMVAEDASDFTDMDDSLGASHGATTAFNLSFIDSPEFPKSGLHPLAVEVSVMTCVVFENVMDFNQMNDSLGASHGGTAAGDLTLIVPSELPESTLVSLDSEVFDLSLADPNPVHTEGHPLFVGGVKGTNFVYMHFMQNRFGAFHAGAAAPESLDKLVSEPEEGSPPLS